MKTKLVNITFPDGETVTVRIMDISEVDTEQYRVFSPADLKILDEPKRYVQNLEKFCRENSNLYPWKDHIKPTDKSTGVTRMLTTYVYVDSNANVFQNLAAVSNYYGVDAEYLWHTYYDRICIPEFSPDSRCFEHLNFIDKDGKKVSLIREWRSSVCKDHGVKDWENLDESTIHSQNIHNTYRFAILVMHAREHMNEGHPRYDAAEKEWKIGDPDAYEKFERNRR